MNPTNKPFPVAIVAVALTFSGLWQGCSRNGADRPDGQAGTRNPPTNSTRKQALSTQAPAETPGDREFIERSKQAIVRHKLTKLPAEKLVFELVAEAPLGTKLLNVRERHDAKAGGDPATAPRLFGIRMEVATGVLSTDARSAAAEFEPLSK